ncbi:MAG: tetratricopeptide repeat protein [Candidatus Bipolaricaulota bacterium]|nr:MAG: tetratricopeptide repeat protein [Candidatus Bipolaricaulota bacterium]
MRTNREGAVLGIRLLGRFEVLREGTPIPDGAWGRRKTETLLKVLLTEPGRVFSQDRLLDLLFAGEDPERARSNLFGRISQLRRALEPGLKRGVNSSYIRREGQGYFFDLSSACWIDTVEFVRLIEEGEKHLREGRNAESTEALEGAVALYRGTFLEADPYEEWTLEAREGWQERYITALTKLAEAYANAGDRHRAVMACRTAFDLRPSRESVLQQLMRYHHAAGERSEALRVYERGVEALKRDLDVEPSSETEALRKTVMEKAGPVEEMVRDRKRIAVLPLVNLSPDPEDEYFADGMTEELIYSLSKVRDLKVIAQTSSLSYKATKKTVGQIGRELSIGSLIEGSVRKAGEQLRITIQLVDVGSEEHLWAEAYDREFRDVFAIQSEIAKEVAGALRAALLDEEVERLEEEPTANLEAYTLYLKGRHFLEIVTEHPRDLTFDDELGAESLERAIEYFRAALEADPGFALASSGLADAKCLLWFYSDVPDVFLAEAGEAARQAVLMAPRIGEGYASQGLVAWIGSKDHGSAERLFRQAIERSPRNPMHHRWLARVLSQLDRRGEALLEILRAREIDPLSSTASLEIADLQTDAGQREDALLSAQEVLELAPGDTVARLRFAQLKALVWDWEGAETECLKAIENDPLEPTSRFLYADILVTLGRFAEAEKTLERGLELSGEPPSLAMLENAAAVYCHMGKPQLALDIFERSAAEKPRWRFAYWWLACCQWMLGNHEAALGNLRKCEETSFGPYRLSRNEIAVGVLFIRGAVLADMGESAKARAAIEEMKRYPRGTARQALGIALVHFHLGELDEGFMWMHRAIEDRCPNLLFIRCCGLPREATEDPRFSEILRSIGLPAEGDLSDYLS